MIYVIRILLVCFYHYLVGKKGKENLAFRSLISSDNFSIPENLHSNKRAVLIYFKQAIRMIWMFNPKSSYLSKSDSLVLITSIGLIKDSIAYVNSNIEVPLGWFQIYSKPTLRISFFKKVIYTGLLCLLFIVLQFFSLFKNKTGYFGYILTSITRITKLRKFVIQKNIKTIYNLSSFQNDSNFLSVCIDTAEMVKIPSSNPIKICYKYLIADKLIYTIPYQEEESIELKDNWVVGQTLFWPPFHYLKLINRKQINQLNIYDIGIVSSGFQRRKLKGDFDTGNNELNIERQLIFETYQISRKHNLRAIILLHPNEKESPKVFEESKTYYNQVLNFDAEYGEFGKSTLDYFNNIDLCLGGFSTILADRIFCGLKTFYAPLTKKNYFNGLSIDKLVVQDVKLLEPSILKALKESHDTFYSNRGLLNYTHFGK